MGYGATYTVNDDPYYCYSDSENQVERAFAYIIKHAKETNNNGWDEKGAHQQAVWELLWNYRGNSDQIAAFKNLPVSHRNDWHAGVYDAAIRQGIIPYSGEKSGKIKTSALVMGGNGDSNIGKINIEELVGKVNSIEVEWKNGKTSTIKGTGSATACQLYSDIACEHLLHVNNIKEGTTIYIKNNVGSRIKSLNISIGQEASGYRIKFYVYQSAYVQNLMYAEVEYGEDSTFEKKISDVIYKTGEITVKKIDYMKSTPLGNAEFVIFEANTGWLGYNNVTKKVTYGNSWANAYKFKAGKSYCGIKAESGEFTLNSLKFSTYYLFEITPPKGYPIYNESNEMWEEFGWSKSDGSKLFEANSNWNMVDQDGEPIPRILLSNKKLLELKNTYQDFYHTNRLNKNMWEVSDEVGKKYKYESDGQQAIKLREKSTSTTDFTYTTKVNFLVRNVELKSMFNNDITIRKIDKDDNTLLNGFKFAIFKLNEGWVGYNPDGENIEGKKGSLTFGNPWRNTDSDAQTKQAYLFETGQSYCGNYPHNGEFTISGLTYGYYYIFEVETNESLGYSIRGQEGCSKVNGNNLFSDNDEWFMNDSEGNPVYRVLYGGELWEKNLVNVDMLDGTPYEFRFSNIDNDGNPVERGSVSYIRIDQPETGKERISINGEQVLGTYIKDGQERYATKHATVTIKNRKDTQLKVKKRDEESGEPIKGVKVKLLVNLREHIYTFDKEKLEFVDKYNSRDNTSDVSDSWYWLNKDGSLTKNYRDAYRFTTNNNGEIIVNKVYYGKYYAYEVEKNSGCGYSAKGYILSEQKGYQGVKPDTYSNNDDFFVNDGDSEEVKKTKQYVYLGNQEIKPQETETPQNTDTRGDKAILSGNYYIVYSEKGNDDRTYLLDTMEIDKNKGLELVLYHKSNEREVKQTFRISYVETGNYLIYNEERKKFITCTEDAEDGKPVKDAILEDCLQHDSSLFSSQQWKFIVNNDGTYNIKTRRDTIKKQTNLHLYGGKIEDKNRIVLQEPENSQKQKFNLINKVSFNKLGITDINTNERIREITAKNRFTETSLTIIKVDDTAEETLGTNGETVSPIYLPEAEFKIYGTDLGKEIDSGWIHQETVDGNTTTTYTDYSHASTFETGDDGKIKISHLKKGTYYIFETKAPKGYDITQQEGYRLKEMNISEDKVEIIPGTSDFSENDDWVYSGNTQTNDVDIPFQVVNVKYITLRGKVWEDNPDGKAWAYNNIYNYNEISNNGQNAIGDKLLKGIHVKLYSNDNNEKPIADTYTNENGEYEFKHKGLYDQETDKQKAEVGLTYWEVANCHIEFDYDNTTYIVATPFVGDNMANSKAQELEIESAELNDANLTGVEGSVPGRAVTKIGEYEKLTKQIIEENKNAENSEKILTSFFNEDTYAIEDINLGLIKKELPSYALSQELAYVKIVRGDYTFKYTYNGKSVIEENSENTQSTIQFQDDAKTFAPPVYPSDINYNIVNNYNGSEDNAYKVYVVYKIGVKNTTNANNIDLYQEVKLNLTSLKNTFDNRRMELSTDVIGDMSNDEYKEEHRQCNLWTTGTVQGNNTTAQLTNINESVFKDGITPNQEIDTFIQFKITQSFLTELLEKPKDEIDNIYEQVPTRVESIGYHDYNRKDKNWKEPGKTFNHITKESDAPASSWLVKWRLADRRSISGTIFKDNAIEERPNENIGNGFMDENENTISDVIVSLMNAENNEVAKVYTGKLVKVGDNNKWQAETLDAIVKAGNDGKYVIPDIVPGRYYLKFIYGNGETEYKDISGNNISIDTKINEENKLIESVLYKSTILTGEAKNANSSNEKTWFIKSIEQGKYSIALDDDNTIKKRINNPDNIEELNYKYSQENHNSVIKATSPIMNIQFEYEENPEKAYNTIIENDLKNGTTTETFGKLRSNCTGMSFGIIERPKVNIVLSKKIKNIKLTLQNGTTIINGDPNEQNVSPYLASINEGNAKLELDPSTIYGSNAIVTYILTAQNLSNLDYATEDYYKYGIINEATKNDDLVKTTVTKIVDYLNNQNASYDNQSENVKNNTVSLGNPADYFAKDESVDVLKANKNYQQLVFKTEKELWPLAATTEETQNKSYTDDYEFTVNNLLSNSDGILGWESYSEIIGIYNRTLTPQSVSHSGNYVVGKSETFEPDTANATVSIYTSTGENRNVMIYCIVAGALIVVALGVVGIKKFVIKKA